MTIPHIASTFITAGSASVSAEARKLNTCEEFLANNFFVSVVFGTLGASGPAGTKLLSKLGRKISDVTEECRSTEFPKEGLSVVIQRGDAASVMWTLRRDPVYVF